MHYLNYQSFSDEKQDSLHEEQSQNIKGPVAFFTTEASANLKHRVGMAYSGFVQETRHKYQGLFKDFPAPNLMFSRTILF